MSPDRKVQPRGTLGRHQDRWQPSAPPIVEHLQARRICHPGTHMERPWRYFLSWRYRWASIGLRRLSGTICAIGRRGLVWNSRPTGVDWHCTYKISKTSRVKNSSVSHPGYQKPETHNLEFFSPPSPPNPQSRARLVGGRGKQTWHLRKPV